MTRIATMFAAVLLLLTGHAQATEAGWALLRNGGQVVFLVHANAPGTGDPANFDINNCRTQRHLSDRGRQQARKIGALFAARAEPVEKVYTSRYCRTRETATLAFGDRLVEETAALDVFPTEEPQLAEAKEAVLKLIRDFSDSGNLVLVTHPENVAAMTGITPREGEAVIVAPTEDGVKSIGRIVFN